MYFVKMCAYIFEICTVVQSNAAAADDNNYSFYFHSLPPNAAARISGGMKFQMVNLVENILALKHLRAFTSYFIHSCFGLYT